MLIRNQLRLIQRIVYFLKGDYNRAIDAFQNSISIEPLFNTYFSMGITYNLMGKYDMAIESQLKAIEFNENNSKSYYEIGLIYLSNKEYDKSIESFQKSLQLDSSHAALSYKEIGEVYCKIKDYDKAISAYQKAIKLVEGSPYFFYDQGIIFNSPSKEIEVQVIRVLPDNKTLFKLYFKIGNFYYYQKNYDKAIEAHEKALKILPPDAEEKKFVYYNIGFIYNKKGDFYKQNKDEAFNKAVLHGLKLEFIESQLQKDLISDFFWEEHYYSI
jgi:tetratricopeptide (TPR) repeat protein